MKLPYCLHPETRMVCVPLVRLNGTEPRHASKGGDARIKDVLGLRDSDGSVTDLTDQVANYVANDGQKAQEREAQDQKAREPATRKQEHEAQEQEPEAQDQKAQSKSSSTTSAARGACGACGACAACVACAGDKELEQDDEAADSMEFDSVEIEFDDLDEDDWSSADLGPDAKSIRTNSLESRAQDEDAVVQLPLFLEAALLCGTELGLPDDKLR